MARIAGVGVARMPRRNQNSSSFLKLPVEILAIQILENYFLNAPIGLPYGVRVRFETELLKIARERFTVLRALAQTCRRLRDICLPLQWEQLNLGAYPRRWIGDAGNPHLIISKMTERVSKGISQNSELSSYVRTITFTLTQCSPQTVLPALARCIQALPNLHTLQILNSTTGMAGLIKNSFGGLSFPQIRTVILPSDAYSLLLHCPEVRHVVCNLNDASQQKLVAPIVKVCKKVERIEGLAWVSKTVLKRLAKHATHLKYLDFEIGGINEEQIKALAGLKQLSELNLKNDQTWQDEAMTLERHKDVIRAARETVAQLPTCVLKLSSEAHFGDIYDWGYRKVKIIKTGA
ncbi:hypothetical protein PQX77_012309 [Marasmius sp. AFHP31]|nr:hypothetical protein PQX77_012309 [Marasmius sp. AFHP31]